MIKIKRIKLLLSCLLCCALTATACGTIGRMAKNALRGGGSAIDGTSHDNAAYGINGNYGLALAARGVRVPVSRPWIYVDGAGYVSGREKKILFAGDKYGGAFEVVRSEDGAVVYTGQIPAAVEDRISGQSFSIADFTDFDEPGGYYIRADAVGQSYPFPVAQDTYENLFLNMLQNVSNVSYETSPSGVRDVSFGMHAILHALQCNGALFEAAYAHLGEDGQLVSQLLYMAQWLISQQGTDGSIYGDYEATAAFCGIIMMSRDSFGRYEQTVDREYRQAAQKAWSWLEAQECGTDARKSARFYAAAQLFRSDGSKECRTAAEEFLRERGRDYSGDPFVFYGVLAYISAGTGTDRDLCTYIMMDMVERTETISAEAQADAFLGTGARTAAANMANMLHIGFVNYLMPSKEYTFIIENTIQYMGGLNEDGVCYFGSDGLWKNTQETAGRRFEWNGIMILAMSDMLQNLSRIE